MAKVGRGPTTEIMKKFLGKPEFLGRRAEKILKLKEVDENPSFTVVMNPGTGKCQYLHAPGANSYYCVDDLDFAEIAKARSFELSYITLIKKLFTDNRALGRITRAV